MRIRADPDPQHCLVQVLVPLHPHLGLVLVPLHLHMILVLVPLHLHLVQIRCPSFAATSGQPPTPGPLPSGLWPQQVLLPEPFSLAGPARVLARLGADSTSTSGPPPVRRPPSHLDLFNLASVASRSGGSHVENPAAAPRGRWEFTVPLPSRGSVYQVTAFLCPPPPLPGLGGTLAIGQPSRRSPPICYSSPFS